MGVSRTCKAVYLFNQGPLEIDKAIDMERFRKKYGKSAYERNGRLMAKARINADFKDALKGFRKMHSKTMKEMGMTKMEPIR